MGLDKQKMVYNAKFRGGGFMFRLKQKGTEMCLISKLRGSMDRMRLIN